MNPRLLLAGWLLAAPTLPAFATPLFTAPFNYAPGNLGSVGSADGWSGSNSGVTVATNSLDGAAHGLPASAGHHVTLTTASASGTYNQFTTGVTTGAVYYSFLLRVNATVGLDSTGKIITGLLRAGSASSYYADVWLRLNGGNVEIGLSKLRAGTTWHGTPIAVGATHFIVVRYQFVTGSNNDGVALWLNPLAGGAEPAPDIAFTTGSDGNDSTGIGRCYLYGGTSVSLDELRIATTWAAAAPAGGTPPPPAAPVFTGLRLAPEGLVFQGANGQPNAAFDLLASGELAAPLTEWNEVLTGNFDPAGAFRLTNPLPPVAPLFFRLRTTGGPPPPAPPVITAHPTNLDLLAGATATFSVTATGTAPLTYRWFFNTNTPAGANLPTLTINNVQTNHAGAYFVSVSNSLGVVTSAVATLTVSNVPAPATILTQPQSQTVPAGQTAVLNVVAAGTPPLFHQWFFNTNTPLPGQTNATLTLTNVQPHQAGAYSVTVTNDYGGAHSAFALLTVDTNAPPDFSAVGFCNLPAPITGGAAGPVVYVGSEAQLKTYSDVNPPYTIYITNSFALSGMSTHIRNHKTVIGLGNIVLTGGGLYLYRSTNVIIRNLTIRNSTEDGIGLHYSANVWIDHCTIEDCADGAVDITQQSDLITISWCRFRYSAAPAGNHNYVSLIASSDADAGNYRVTYHHNWWDVNCVERMPSVRFGRAHIFNNYYEAPGNSYCVRTRKDAECRVEHNFFRNVRNPWERYITSASHVQGKLFATGNNVPFLGTDFGVTWTGTTTNRDGTIREMIPGTDTVFTPPYSYTLRPAAAVPTVVTNHAGAQRGPFAPWFITTPHHQHPPNLKP